MPHNSWADCYDCAYKLTYGEAYQQFTDQTLGVVGQLVAPPARIVDFGAGTGRLAIPLAQMGYKVTAVEASAEMCRVLRMKAAAGVEGAVTAPCAVCQQTSVPTEQRHPVEVEVCNQSICEPLPKNGFDLGLCVFTVLNYQVEEKGLQQFAAVAARAIRADGQLLVSFVENMRPMQDFLKEPKTGRSPDGSCSVERKINIDPVQGVHYQYHEKSILTKDGQRFPYEDQFPLREWSRTEIIRAFGAAGFSKEADLTGKFPGRGEVYLQFRRKPVSGHHPDPYTIPPDWEPGSFPPPKTTRIILDLKPGTEGDV